MLSIRLRGLLVVCALLVPFAVACEPAADEPDADPFLFDEEPAAVDAPPPALEVATDRYVAAWNGDDPEAVAAFFTADATAVVDDDTFQGRAEIQEGWLQLVPDVSNLEATETSVRRVGDDWQSEGTYTGTISAPDAEPMDASGRYTVTWTRDADGEWRIRSTEVHADEPAEN
jgi:uncharacterized protein (TIGR02246 family)